MAIWLMSDTHFGHLNMVKLQGRPEDFEDRIVRHWRKNIAPTDTLIHLGDVALCSRMVEREWFDIIKYQLPGIKILVRGNHDKRAITWYEANGFALCVDSFERVVNGRHVLFTHEPRSLAMNWGDVHLNVHGHLHTNDYPLAFGASNRNRCFSLERTQYQPVEVGSFIEKYRVYA